MGVKMKRSYLKTKDTQMPINFIDDEIQEPDIIIQKKQVDSIDKSLSPKHLQDAIIWSEILGKPVCKRRKRSYYGY